MKTALVIMAAGLGSRYGGGIKQIQPVGPGGEIIIDYSIHDALAAGFDRIIFVIRKDIEADFMEAIGNRIGKTAAEKGAEVCIAFQDMEDIPVKVDACRTKPWGTGHAVLAARKYLDMPFAVINADDYYGKTAYKVMHDFLEAHTGEIGLAGFILENTLSENGGVTRGICEQDADGCITKIEETKNIVRDGDMADADGKKIALDSPVSMNFWGFGPDMVCQLQESFADFLKKASDIQTDEFLLPTFVDQLIHEKGAKVKVLPTPDRWFGITYAEDLPAVQESFKELIKNGEYKADLYADA